MGWGIILTPLEKGKMKMRAASVGAVYQGVNELKWRYTPPFQGGVGWL
jgi:hypothetical protein